ncbi:hypothetical protein LCGC14_0438940 [marine sediment metagenome]|uniref:Uncharacterized protein n=1 Tax=marine sediment metagenome TaxID=412755 RepID=A0A0F9V7R8_9ZZZZ
MYEDGFPWIKFIILTIPGMVLMFMFAPTLKWKFMFAFSVPIGVGLALAGKSINIHKRKGDY